MTMPTVRLTRRRATAIIAAGVLAPALPAQAALSDSQARALIDEVVAEINRTINSGKSQGAMLAEFERIFRRYGDVPIIARSTLGADARRASSAQLSAFADAFAGYMARKYGRRFREFAGGTISVQSARKVKTYTEVESVVRLPGQAPFGVVFRVSDRSGRGQFFDMVIEGISLIKTERTEIGALLDQNRGNIDAMIADLRKRG